MDLLHDVSILEDVLQSGHIPYEKLIKNLMVETSSSFGYFFQSKSSLSSQLACKYTSDAAFDKEKSYSWDSDEISSLNSFTIYYKSNPIALISLENMRKLWENRSKLEIGRFHNAICISVVLDHCMREKYTFTKSICDSVQTVIANILQLTSSKSAESQKIVKMLEDVSTMLLDTMDYNEIDVGNLTLERDYVPMKDFIKETLRFVGLNPPLDIDDNVPDVLVFDRSRVQLMLIDVLRRVMNVRELFIKVQFKDYTFQTSSSQNLTFRLSSALSSQNKEIKSRYEADQLELETIDIFLVKRLCELMSGTVDVTEESGLELKIRVESPAKKSST